MSFSGDAKNELSRQISKGRHCQIAEITSIVSLCGKINRDEEGKYQIIVYTENVTIARKYFTLIKKTFNINTSVSIRRNAYLKKNRTYILSIRQNETVIRILQTMKLLNEKQELINETNLVNGLIIRNACCKRAFIRGAFLSAGSISDPGKFYHFEIVCVTQEKAEQLQEIINSFEMDAKIVKRKKYFVVYIKEGEQIVDILNIMGAHVALMQLENVRIEKEMRNAINRQVNCETANIKKTVNAATKQIYDIELLQRTIGFEQLPEGLKEIAELRLKHPDATLKELGEMLAPTVGKSGVNHRLRKLSNLAEDLKN